MVNIVLNALSLRPGGGLQVLVALATGLSNSRPSDQFTILYSDPNTKTRLDKEFSDIPNIQIVNPVEKQGTFGLFKWQMTKLKKFLRSNNADLLIGLNHYFPSGDIAQIIYHVNTMRFQRARKTVLRPSEIADRMRDKRASEALQKADANVFESQYLWNLASKNNPKIQNPHKIYIGMDEQSEIQPSQYSGKGVVNILALTSPQPHKDNRTLVRTLAVLKKLKPKTKWRLQVAGGVGENAFEDLEPLILGLCVTEDIDWLGFQSHEDLQQHGQNALCLVSTSLTESFSMVALEAMSWSCPVVLTNAASMPESINGAGLLAEAKKADDFAHQIIRYQEDSVLRNEMIKLGHKRIKNLTWANAAREFNKVIEQLL